MLKLQDKNESMCFSIVAFMLVRSSCIHLSFNCNFPIMFEKALLFTDLPYIGASYADVYISIFSRCVLIKMTIKCVYHINK